MKKVIILTLMLLNIGAFANTNSLFNNNVKEFEEATIQYAFTNNDIENLNLVYNFNELNDFSKFEFQNKIKDYIVDDTCTVTITASVSVKVGNVTVTVSGEITTSCENAKKATKELIQMLKDSVT